MDAHTDYRGKGVDQLAEVIAKLKHKPYDRRIILSAWNPADLHKMALPPCHMFAQFYVSFPGDSLAVAAAATTVSPAQSDSDVTTPATTNNAPPPPRRGVLSCQLYQRSCDIGLGVPFNIASYALLTHMLAVSCDLDPGTFILAMGDAHIYTDHVDALKAQLEREPREFPELWIRKETGCEIDGWTAEDFEVRGYKPHPAIGMKMSV